MDDVARRRRVLLSPARAAAIVAAWLAGAACVACAARSRAPAIGVSETPPVMPPTASDAGAIAARDAGDPLAGWPAMTKVNAARFTSKGHAAGRWDAEVSANDAGREALRTGIAPVGAALSEEQWERADGTRGPTMLMKKEAPGFDPARGDWRYVVVGSDGRVVADGAVESCAGCHGDAPRDHVFSLDAK